MKKQKKQLILLIVLLAVLIGGYYGIGAYEDWAADKKNEDRLATVIDITNFDEKKIETITYNFGDEIITFKRDGENWIYPADPSLDIDESKVDHLASTVAKQNTDVKIENVTDLSQYGLKDPSVTIDFVVEGTQYTMLLGDYNSMISSYYVCMKSDLSTVYTVNSQLRASYTRAFEQYLVEEEEDSQETESLESSSEEE